MFSLKRTAFALAATISVFAGSAFASGDIVVTNSSKSSLIHPYFRTNCWNPAIVSAGANDWAFAGAINAFSQFNWEGFYSLLDPACKNPIVKFTYTLPGEDPPHDTDVSRTVVLHYDATMNYQIQLGDDVVVKGVVTTQ